MSKLIATVIIPTYNEKGNIDRTIKQLDEVFAKIDNWQMKILVVDDRSPDKTYEIVESLKTQYKYLHLLINPKKSGLGHAYLKGMEYAFNELKSDVIFEFDADLSHDPTKIPDFLSKIEAGNDLVIGSRYMPGGSIPTNWGLHRKFLSIVGNIVIKVILTNFSISDWTTGFRAITKKVYRAISPEMTDEKFSGYTFQIGFLHKSAQKKFKIAEVPFKFQDRTIGKSKIGPEYIVNNLIYLFKTRWQDLLKSRVFKFLIVGTIGASIQFLSEALLQFFMSYLVAHIIAIEIALISNFVLSNLWTFADRKIKKGQIPKKLVEFNRSSAGSILIQIIIGFLGISLIGILDLFKVPLINFTVNTGMIFTAIGILLGMFWNFFAYNFFIWKKK